VDTVFDEHDHRRHRPRSWLVEGVTKVEQLRFLERENKCTLGQAALQYVLRSPSVVTALPNIYNADQVDEFAAAPDQLSISDAQAAEVERLFETNYGLPVGEPTNATAPSVENVKAGTSS
jgi:aryl-alcohol dehydrogenase-like predicted oxidoreductase